MASRKGYNKARGHLKLLPYKPLVKSYYYHDKQNDVYKNEFK